MHSLLQVESILTKTLSCSSSWKPFQILRPSVNKPSSILSIPFIKDIQALLGFSLWSSPQEHPTELKARFPLCTKIEVNPCMSQKWNFNNFFLHSLWKKKFSCCLIRSFTSLFIAQTRYSIKSRCFYKQQITRYKILIF